MTEFMIGVYARYQGKEYHARDNHNGTVYMTSRDPGEQAHGFKLWGHGIYEITVPRSAVEALYLVQPYAIYKGVEVTVEGIEDGVVQIGLCDIPPDEGWHMIGRGDHIKKVSFEELDRYWLDVMQL